MKSTSLTLVISVFMGLLCFDLAVSLLCGANQAQSDLTVRQHALEQFDADGDGRLNAVEREAIRKAGSPFAVKRPKYIRDRRRHEQRIKKYDKDGDGELKIIDQDSDAPPKEKSILIIFINILFSLGEASFIQ